ncbi:MAG TPA: N-acetylmuramoyl-L-alanine amidase [Usitatibacter sp.]|nr:N-acetylmuramoyl-L-alanine amidase [Usitatibacter sp.]
MKKLSTFVACILMAGCAAVPGGIDTSFTSESQDSRVQFLVIHCTTGDFYESVRTLTHGPVSAHYLVRDDPVTVYRLVDESRRAWHAGDSSWQGNTQLNSASIGIEIVNRGPHDGTWDDYPPAQIDAVIALVKDIVKRHGIRADRIVGHSDIAPQRKLDPGPRFPWKRLADEGLIPWPDAAQVATNLAEYQSALPDVLWFQQHLDRLGYDTPFTGMLDVETRNVIAAFQMRYRQRLYDGAPDAETAAILEALARK